MPYNPGISYRGDQYQYGGMRDFTSGIMSGVNNAMNIWADNKRDKEKDADKEKSQKSYLDGVEQVRKSDPNGVMASLMGDKSAHEIGYDGVRGMMEASGEMAKIGRELLAQNQARAAATQEKGFKTALSNWNGDMGAFTKSLLDNGVTDPEVVKSAQGIVQTMKEAGWKPEKMDVGGTQMVTTSPRSAVPLKADDAQSMVDPSGKDIPGVDGFKVVDLGNGRRQVVDTRNKKPVNMMELFLAKNAGVINDDQLQNILKTQYGDMDASGNSSGAAGGGTNVRGFFDDL